MNKEQISVAQFMSSFGQDVPKKLTLPTKEVQELRVRLIEEELIELKDAFAMDYMAGIADGIADLLYVVYGTAVACGLDAERIFDEVHRSNMSKFWTASEVATEFREDAQLMHQWNDYKTAITYEGKIAQKVTKTRWIVKDSEGKVLKSPSYSRADIESKLY